MRIGYEIQSFSVFDFLPTVFDIGIAYIIHKVADLPLLRLAVNSVLDFLYDHGLPQNTALFVQNLPCICPMLRRLLSFGCEKRSAEHHWGVKRGLPLLQDDAWA